MNSPLVSIIIATYNSEKTLRKALHSVADQTFQDWECLVVDGASKDNTLEIVKEFESQDSRFRHISEPDNGIYDAFNKGWKNAKGKWIYYLGSDDWLEKDGLFDLMKEESSDYAILSGDVNIIKSDGSITTGKAGFPKVGHHQGMAMQRQVMERMGGFDEKYSIIADYDLIIRILNANYKMKVGHAVIANFIVGGTSQKLSNMYVYAKERYEINKKFKSLKHPILSTMETITRKYGSIIIHNIVNKFKHLRTQH